MQKNLPTMRKATVLPLLILVTLLSLPSLAQRGPNISRVIHNGTRTLNTGEGLDVILIGDPGGSARFEILGAIRSYPMTEVSQGRYEAHYKIPKGLEVDRGIVIGYLSKYGSESALESANPVTIKMGSGSSPTAKPKTITTVPKNNGTTEKLRPTVRVDFPTAIMAGTARLYVDGIDFTRKSKLSNGNRRLDWKPHYDLSRAKHTAEVEATDVQGNRVSHKWAFTIGKKSPKKGRIKTFMPEENSTTSHPRPSIGVVFRNDVTNPRLVIDGRDFTSQSHIKARQIHWQPNYDLSAGKHWAEVTALTKKGKQVKRRWNFTLGQASNTISNVSFSPANIRVGQAVTVNVKATPGLKMTFDLGTKRINMPLTESTTPGVYYANYTAQAGDQGQHAIFARTKLPNGNVLAKSSATHLLVEGGGMTVDNIREGMGVPANFNVQGSCQSGGQVTVVTEYAKRDFLGAVSGQMKRTTFTGNVGANRRFDVPVHIGLKKGTKFKLTVTSSAGGQPLVYNLIRQ